MNIFHGQRALVGAYSSRQSQQQNAHRAHPGKQENLRLESVVVLGDVKSGYHGIDATIVNNIGE